MTRVAAQVAELREELAAAEPERDLTEKWERDRQRRDSAIRISREERNAWRVTGGSIERMVVQTDWENEDAVAYLQHRFSRCGLDDKLRRAGAVTGDEIRILGFAFDYEGDEPDSFAELREDEVAFGDEEA